MNGKKNSIIAAGAKTAILKPETFDLEYLSSKARWIRDNLDPQVAVNGEDALTCDDILNLDEFLRALEWTRVSLHEVRCSRIHRAVEMIAGVATRWPAKLIDRCDAIKNRWEDEFGPWSLLGTPLYEPGGRLHGICGPEDVDTEQLIAKWLKSSSLKTSPAIARKTGDMGFIPGDWWMNSLFAHHDGIIDSPQRAGGIVSDGNGAYAIILTDNEEGDSTSPEHFKYYAKDHDPGRYRLTAASSRSRNPIRVLRDQSLHSFWRPRAGLRYDGLYRVIGWTWKRDERNGRMSCIVEFERLKNQVSMQAVLCRPRVDEIEDYEEYEYQRAVHRKEQRNRSSTRVMAKSWNDGTADSFGDDSVQTPFLEYSNARCEDEHVN